MAQIRLLERKFPGVRISITSRTPKLDRRFYKSQKIRVLPQFFAVPSLYSSRPGKIWHVLAGGLSPTAKLGLVREIRRSDLVIGSGGGYFFSYRRHLPGPMFFQNFFSVRAATACRKPVLLFPQSFGPLFNPLASRMLRRLFEHESILKIYAREPVSDRFLQQLLSPSAAHKTGLCPDLAFLLGTDYASGPKPWGLELPKPVLALTARPWIFPGVKGPRDRQEKQRHYLSVLEEACLTFHRKWRGSIVIVPQARGPGPLEDDRQDSRTIWRRLRPLIPANNLAYLDLPPMMSPSNMIEIFARADLILATRFHSAIFGLALGIPVISIAYQPKSVSVLEWLDLDDWSLALDDLSVDKIVGLMDQIFREGIHLREKIRHRVASARMTIEARLGTFLENVRESQTAR